MGSRGKLLFDLNEPPAEDALEGDSVICFQPQKAVPSSHVQTSHLFPESSGSKKIENNNAFSHASSVSGFQPFNRMKGLNASESIIEIRRVEDSNSKVSLSSRSTGDEDTKTHLKRAMETNLTDDMESDLVENIQATDDQAIEREEGEWSDAEGSVDVLKNTCNSEQSTSNIGRVVQEHGKCNMKNLGSKDDEIGVAHSNSLDQNCGSIQNLETVAKGENPVNGSEENSTTRKRDVKGVEASHALRCANSLGNKQKVDQQKEAMLGKKRSRQTMFLNFEDVKQAGPLKSATPRRQNFSSPLFIRSVKQNRGTPSGDLGGEKQNQPAMKNQKQGDNSQIEVGSNPESGELSSEYNDDTSPGIIARPTRQNSSNDITAESAAPSVARQGSWKQPTDSRQPKNSQVSTKKPATTSQSNDLKLENKRHPPKKQVTNSVQYQDTSVERLIREVTNEKLWHHPEETEFQRVPGQFESMDEYVSVFEPLLFEECRAQLYSTWEELGETPSRDTHVMVHIKNIERRERGWYDVVVLPMSECKWTFKEGDVAVLSKPKPGSARSRRSSYEDNEEKEISGRIAGTIRRHIPIDTRDPLGATLHFYVGDSYDPNSMAESDHILKKLQPKDVWFVTVLGSLATTQREYVALHAFRRLHVQMQTAILHPSPKQFPKYEEQPPAMPECFTPNFIDYLHKTFNGPQLSAIQWAAMHTAAGTSGAMPKRQDPWPFTLVQGPPGTGKTHTVWGMLNVIHLVQYQHYYAALLKKLAPESYKQPNENVSESAAAGSIDEVLQSMDQNLFRTLPKLCPKPRMLVCAPSNAATDELLSRVLERGFLDGEMKTYKPDIARVGVDSQTRAAQTVSVERRTEVLLAMGWNEVSHWMKYQTEREHVLSQQIARLQRDLALTAVVGRSQGSVGVDPDVLLSRDQNRDALLQNLASVVEDRDKALVELSRLFILQGKLLAEKNGVFFNTEEAKANLEASFANEAEIVFTTVSSSGRKLFSRLTHGFDMVVIDEAAQASEMAVLPPLSLGAARCVLVGDPQQLPATVISKAAGSLLYSRSLFERFQQAGCPTMLLSVQYRMHPQIRDFPSRHFYQGRLSDSDTVVSLPDEKYYQDQLLRPYIFYDITHGRESHRGGSVSYQNIHEAQFCLHLYEHLQKTSKSLGCDKISVGIITPYKLQLKCLQREFEDVLKTEEGKDIYINTVDAFQGQERDVIIMSCVRASNHGVGFVSDIRRMNVALTRARRALWVMGNATALMQCDDWAALIADAKARNCYLNMDSLPKEFVGSNLKGPSFPPLAAGRLPSNTRGLRTGPRHRFSEISTDSRSGIQMEINDSSNESTVYRNGSYRSSRASLGK